VEGFVRPAALVRVVAIDCRIAESACEAQTVTWQARHFGVRQQLTSRITVCQRPHHFHDSMVRGAFARLEHDVTVMRDTFEFASPLGIWGRMGDAVVMTRYLQVFIAERNAVLKPVAESEEWRQFLA
jgi:hypothetical protein